MFTILQSTSNLPGNSFQWLCSFVVYWTSYSENFNKIFELRMNIFQRIKERYAILGIRQSSQSSQKYQLNRRILFGFLVFGCNILSQILFIFRVANGFIEYVDCICATSATMIIFVCFATNVFNRVLLFEVINNIENLIDSSKTNSNFNGISFKKSTKNQKCILGCKFLKSKEIFLKTSRQVDRLCELVFLVIMKISAQGIILSKCIISFSVYFITDSGSDSFVLPFPMW